MAIEITGSRERGQNITGWQDGKTQARIWWRGTGDDPDDPGATWTEYTAIAVGERQALIGLGHIAAFVNVELICAELEPLGAVKACPRCDHVLPDWLYAPWCPRCRRHITRQELEDAAKVKAVTESAMDVIDKAVSDGTLPG